MKRFFISLIALVASVTYSQAQNITADSLDLSNWAALSFNDKGLMENKSKRPPLFSYSDESRNKAIVFCTVDSLLIESKKTGNCSAKKDAGIVFLNKEMTNNAHTRPAGIKETTKEVITMQLPRPLVTDSNTDVHVLHLSVEGLPDSLVIYRKWSEKTPDVSLSFTHRDSSQLDFIITADKDSTIITKDEWFKLSSIRIRKSENESERLVKVNSIQVGDSVFVTGGVFKDEYCLSEPIEIRTDLDISEKQTVKVDYSYLDNSLNEQIESVLFSIDIPEKHPSVNVGTVLAAILLGLTLLFALTLILFSPQMKPRKMTADKTMPEADGRPVQTASRVSGDSEKEKIAKFLESINAVFGEAPVNQTYTEFVSSRVNDFKARIKEKDDRIQELQAIQNGFEKIFGNLETGIDYEAFFSGINNRAFNLERIVTDYFGKVPPEQTYAQFLSKEIEDLQIIPAAICKEIRPPQDQETYVSIIRETANELNQVKSKLEGYEQEKSDALQRQKEEITSDYDRRIKVMQGSLDTAQHNASADMKLFQAGILTLLSRMQYQYDRFTRRAKTTSKFGDYARKIGIPFTSYVENLKRTVCQDGKDESTVSDIINEMRPLLLNSLNDQTSWLNDILRMETYEHAEVLRQPMREGGLNLSALSELYCALHGLLGGIGIELQSLPELFANTTDLSDYQLNHKDHFLGLLLDFKDEDAVRHSAIVDLVKAGYTISGEAPVKSTIIYHDEPQA
jgi:hypothetical protein